VSEAADGILIVLADELRRPGFDWPTSAVRAPVEFGPGWDLEAGLSASAEDGRAVSVQLSDVRDAGAGSVLAKVHLLADLPAGQERRFRISAGQPTPLSPPGVQSERVGDVTILDNGLLRVEVPTSGSPEVVLRLGSATRWLGSARLTLAARGLEARLVHSGPVFVEYALTYRFAGGRRYHLSVRLTAGMEFVELDERIEGFERGDDAALVFDWDQTEWTHRYCANRPDGPIDGHGGGYRDFAWEAVDRGLGPAGALPMELVPYHSWLTWWRVPAVAFWNESDDVSLGVFVADHERWDDGEYALWGSSDTLAARFFFDRGVLRWRFPLVAGSRRTAVATFPHSRDVEIVERTGTPLTYIDTLHRWHGWLPLDKVKDWTLDHVEPSGTYPRFFDPHHHEFSDAPADRPAFLERLIAAETPSLNLIPDGAPRSNHGPGPVSCRDVFHLLVPLFDETAGDLSDGTRRDLGAAYQFLAYVFHDETLMPVRRLLAGHPNFLTEILAVAGTLPFLFPHHPDARLMADHFERGIALNLKYHTRPDVPAWQAQGGRWTENLGCYVWGPVELMVLFSHLLRRHFDGHNRLARPETSALGYWLLNTFSAPLEAWGGRRTLPPQGAHATGRPAPRALRVLGQELAHFDPLLSEYLLWVAPASTQDRGPRAERSYDTWGHLQSGQWHDNTGTDPELESAKFTGYGFVLRAAMGTPDEVTVYLQQLDAGPNYRWGRAARGGNGIVYYYAAGRRYSYNNVEDVGDVIRGDVERCTNFGVRKPGGYRDLGPFRSVDMNELTQPLHDFGFVQFAQVDAGGSAAPDYVARSVVLSGADYIVLFDEVQDGVAGRFSWFTEADGDFPSIAQLTPGVAATAVPAEPEPAGYDSPDPWMPTKGRYYDGTGSFLTVVSHLSEMKSGPTSFGAVVHVGGREDLVFRSAEPCAYDDADGVAFRGTAGIVRRHGGNRVEAALFVGDHIAVPGFAVTTDGSVAISVTTGDELGGVVHARNAAAIWLRAPSQGQTFYLDGMPLPGEPAGDQLVLRIPAGRHRWEYTAGAPTPGRPQVLRTENHATGFTLVWTPVAGATGYHVELSTDGGKSWQQVAAAVAATRYPVTGVAAGTKVHARVVAQGRARAGQASRPYPVYVSPEVPHSPDGLWVRRVEGGILASWGEVLGAYEYRLYRRRRGQESFTLIGSGLERQHLDTAADEVAEYRVSAVNGNGEGVPGAVRDTEPGGMIDWDPRPDEVFRRATQSYESGYEETNPWIEEKMPILSYPDPERRHWTGWRA